MASLNHSSDLSTASLVDWLDTPLGRYLLRRELAYYETAISDIFGFHALQIGLPSFDFLSGSRITAKHLLDLDEPAHLYADPAYLPFAENSIDLIVLPHVLEKSGRINNTAFTFDTTIFATYVGASFSGPGGGGGGGVAGKVKEATVDVYLYDDDGVPMRSATGQDVCNPCSATLSPRHRKLNLSLDEEFDRAGGFPTPQGVVTGYGVIVVGGHDDGVAIQGFVVNSHTSPFDLSVFGFEPQEIKTTVP